MAIAANNQTTKPIQSVCQVGGCFKAVTNFHMCQDHYRRWKRNGDPLAPKETHRREALEAFIHAAVISETNECIIWPYAKTANGYGMVCFGKKMMVTRIVTERFHGSPPSTDAVAAHLPITCHNPSCINPRHLRWATPLENSADMKLDLTRRKGEENAASKLTEKDVREIRKSEETGAVLSRRYGVSQSLVSMIRRRKVWSHV